MIHSWYDSLTAEQQKDLLDSYMQHEPDFLGGRERTGSNPLVSYRDISTRWKKKIEAGIFKHPLITKIRSLEEAVRMTEGEYVDGQHQYSDGKSALARFVKTNDTYRAGQTINEDDEGFAAWLNGEKEEFLAIHNTANEYFAYEAMYSKPTMPTPIYEAMTRNGFDNQRFEEMMRQVMNVVRQLRIMDPKYESTIREEAALKSAI